jgi:hypothetical protein
LEKEITDLVLKNKAATNKREEKLVNKEEVKNGKKNPVLVAQRKMSL